mmetsp:Transcript_44417/g.117863  ORF Transcript_44417/g.117863 Transcript_44417/m.117863 type:complete len:234 (+) Transcript_44417:541-1242(+)
MERRVVALHPHVHLWAEQPAELETVDLPQLLVRHGLELVREVRLQQAQHCGEGLDVHQVLDGDELRQLWLLLKLHREQVRSDAHDRMEEQDCGRGAREVHVAILVAEIEVLQERAIRVLTFEVAVVLHERDDRWRLGFQTRPTRVFAHQHLARACLDPIDGSLAELQLDRVLLLDHGDQLLILHRLEDRFRDVEVCQRCLRHLARVVLGAAHRHLVAAPVVHQLAVRGQLGQR